MKNLLLNSEQEHIILTLLQRRKQDLINMQKRPMNSEETTNLINEELGNINLLIDKLKSI
jgi:hypothetical protein